jgi:hypothetical protein
VLEHLIGIHDVGTRIRDRNRRRPRLDHAQALAPQQVSEDRAGLDRGVAPPGLDRLLGKRAMPWPDLEQIARRLHVAVEQTQSMLLDLPTTRAAVGGQLLFRKRFVEG